MLSNFGTENLKVIRQSIDEVWGNQAVITNMEIFPRPFDAFEVYITIHQKHRVKLCYDRSIIDLAIQVNGEYEWLTVLTNQKVVEGFKSSEHENLLHNFHVLDEVIKKLS